jgi:hypothetical protein
MSSRLKLSSPQLEATLLAIRLAGKDLRKELYARSRATILPEWQSSLSDKAGANRLAQRVLVSSARVNIGTRGIELTSAKSTKAISKGGLIPAINFAAIEFGASWRTATIAGRRGAKAYRYSRQINTAFKHRQRKGYIVYPTANIIITRLAALWVQTTVRTFRDAVESK